MVDSAADACCCFKVELNCILHGAIKIHNVNVNAMTANFPDPLLT